MSIEQDLNRIAIALEVIARYAEKLANPVVQFPQVVYRDTPERMTETGTPGIPSLSAIEAAATEASLAPGTVAPVKSDREILMAQLDDLKLPYPAKASVKRLKEILATHGTSRTPPVTPSMFETPAVEPKAAPTVDEARDALKRFAAKYGSDKAVKILTDFKAENVTAIASAGLLVEFVNEVLKQEKEHERK